MNVWYFGTAKKREYITDSKGAEPEFRPLLQGQDDRPALFDLPD
jgi:hypothetical protein